MIYAEELSRLWRENVTVVLNIPPDESCAIFGPAAWPRRVTRSTFAFCDNVEEKTEAQEVANEIVTYVHSIIETLAGSNLLKARPTSAQSRSIAPTACPPESAP